MKKELKKIEQLLSELEDNIYSRDTKAAIHVVAAGMQKQIDVQEKEIDLLKKYIFEISEYFEAKAYNMKKKIGAPTRKE